MYILTKEPDDFRPYPLTKEAMEMRNEIYASAVKIEDLDRIADEWWQVELGEHMKFTDFLTEYLSVKRGIQDVKEGRVSKVEL